MAKNYYTSIEAAKRLGLSVGTIQKMVDKGTLISWRTEGGHRRIAYDAVESYAIPISKVGIAKQGLAVFLVTSDQALHDLLEGSVRDFAANAVLVFASDPYIAMLETANTKPDLFILDMSSRATEELSLLMETLGSNQTFNVGTVILLTDSDEVIEKFSSQLKGKAVMLKKPFCQKTFYGYLLAKFSDMYY